jgi:hypothetical protein
LIGPMASSQCCYRDYHTHPHFTQSSRNNVVRSLRTMTVFLAYVLPSSTPFATHHCAGRDSWARSGWLRCRTQLFPRNARSECNSAVYFPFLSHTFIEAPSNTTSAAPGAFKEIQARCDKKPSYCSSTRTRTSHRLTTSLYLQNPRTTPLYPAARSCNAACC